MKSSTTSHRTQDDRRLLRLHERDNVLTLTVSVPAGEPLPLGDEIVTAAEPMAVGHKVAARSIAVGEKIVKYGVAIGSAVRAIAPGEHVHTHNTRSDYIPTYLHETQREYFSKTEE